MGVIRSTSTENKVSNQRTSLMINNEGSRQCGHTMEYGHSLLELSAVYSKEQPRISSSMPLLTTLNK